LSYRFRKAKRSVVNAESPEPFIVFVKALFTGRLADAARDLDCSTVTSKLQRDEPHAGMAEYASIK
jgi:hypothetical protein